MNFIPKRPIVLTGRASVVVKAGAVLVAVLVVVGAALGYRATRPNTDPVIAAPNAAGVAVFTETETYTGDVGGVGVEGTLVVLAGNCLGLAGTDSDGSLVVFPAGTEVFTDDGAVAVRVPGDGSRDPRFRAKTLHPGDRIDGGTRGSGPLPIRRYGAKLAAVVPASCRGYQALDVDPNG